MRDRPAGAAPAPAAQRIGRAALGAMGASIGLTIMLGIEGPRAGRATFPPAPPWPPWFLHVHPSIMVWSITLWLVELLGGGGLTLALLAAARGWRPPYQGLILGSVIAVIALMITPPVDNGDPLYYAAYGRITVLGQHPYAPSPVRLLPPSDPVRAAVPFHQADPPSRYGPMATSTEAAASALAGDSPARTVFWLKAWNALTYLALVLALDRTVRSDAARRVRAHLLWSLNPLMLFAVMASGHNDVLAASAGAVALFAIRPANCLRGMLAGVLVGLATAIKAPYALFGAGLAWTVRRSPRSLAALALGAAAAATPGYLLAGRAAIAATTTGLVAGEQPDLLWHEAAGMLGWQNAVARTNLLGIIGCVALALLLLRRMPPGPDQLPAVRVALALGLGLLVASPLQTLWYDAMIFPLLAVFTASRLDWIIVARSAALAEASAPFLNRLNPSWLTIIQRISNAGSPTLSLAAIIVALLWLCLTGAWQPATRRGGLRAIAVSADLR